MPADSVIEQLTAGVSFKPEYFEAAHACAASGMWYEIHPENYMIAGGPRLAMLDAMADQHPISVHGVGLSLAGASLPDVQHLQRLHKVITRTQAALVSEHLAWSTTPSNYLPDLLPFPRTHEALLCVARNIEFAQEFLQRRILIENPSLYVSLDHEYDEVEFLNELVIRTGCGLLVDINNVFVSAHNLNYSAADYLRRLPVAAIGEIHLAGHAQDTASGLLIDSHAAEVAQPVWSLYESLLVRIGARPTLIERDDNLPEFAELLSEREHAAHSLRRVQEARYANVG